MPDLNALRPIAEIQSLAELMTNHGYDIKPELFYSKQLMDTIRIDAKEYIHFRYAETNPIQGKAEKLQVRRWAPLYAHTTPLEEGIPPQSDKGSMESWTVGTNQYGRFMEFSDKVDWNTIDPVIMHYTQQYSIVAIETLDLLAREAMFAVAQKKYAAGRANMEALEIGDKPSIADLRFLVLLFDKAKVKARNGGKFHVLHSSEFEFDMIDDPIVQQYMSLNQTTKPFFDNGSLIPMFNLEFYKTQATLKSGEFYNGSGDLCLRVFRMNSNTSQYEYATLDEATYFTSAAGYRKDERTGFDGTYDPNIGTWDIAKYNDTANSDGYGEYKELIFDRTLVLGSDALIRTNIEGRDSAKMFVKALGSAGVLDPIDQRQSIGFKIDAVGFGSPRPEAIVEYVSICTYSNM